MVIVDPYEVGRPQQRRQLSREPLVHPPPRLVLFLTSMRVGDKAMHQRPERAVAETFVVLLDLGLAEFDRQILHAIVVASPRRRLGVPGGATPAEPQSA